MNKAERNSVVRQLVVQTLVWLAITGALLFAAAGTVRWPEAWAYLGLWLAGAVVSGSLLVQKNPDILKERMRSPMQSQQKRWDRPLLMAIFGGWAALQIVAGLDVVRYGWSRMPLWLESRQCLGGGHWHLCVSHRDAGEFLRVPRCKGRCRTRTLRRLERTLRLGPASVSLYFLGTALLLGSWYAFAIGIVLIVIIALRAVWEEETLRAELPGYADYASGVKYRLVPGLW